MILTIGDTRGAFNIQPCCVSKLKRDDDELTQMINHASNASQSFISPAQLLCSTFDILRRYS